MNPEYPIFSTTLCYLERDDAYLMLHRVKKEDDYNHEQWWRRRKIRAVREPGGLPSP